MKRHETIPPFPNRFEFIFFRSKSRSVDHGLAAPFDLDSLRSKVEGRFDSVERLSKGMCAVCILRRLKPIRFRGGEQFGTHVNILDQVLEHHVHLSDKNPRSTNDIAFSRRLARTLLMP